MLTNMKEYRPYNHKAAMLSPEGVKTFVFAHWNLVPNHFNSRLGVRNLLSIANMVAA